MEGGVDTRSEVLPNHPELVEIVYIYEDIITKDLFTKKVVSFEATDANKRKSIAADIYRSPFKKRFSLAIIFISRIRKSS